MLKSIERGIEIGSIVLVEKRGGARGDIFVIRRRSFEAIDRQSQSDEGATTQFVPCS